MEKLTKENIEKHWFFTVEIEDGEKVIHITHSYYKSDEGHCEEYTFAYISIKEFLEKRKDDYTGNDVFCDVVMEVKQYCSNETDKNYQKLIDIENEDLDNGSTKYILLKDITEDIEEGDYCGC